MKRSTTLVILHIYLFVFQAYCVVLKDVGNANDYVDEVLKNLRDTPDLVSQFDPLKIPNLSEKWYKVYDGEVKGLSHLYRSGDCTLKHDDDVTTVSAEVAVRDVSLFTRYGAKALFFWLYGDADGKVEHLAVRIELSVKNARAELREFKVAQLGKYYVTRMNGASVVFNWLVKIIVNSILGKKRGLIIQALEGGAANALRDLLSKIDVPL